LPLFVEIKWTTDEGAPAGTSPPLITLEQVDEYIDGERQKLKPEFLSHEDCSLEVARWSAKENLARARRRQRTKLGLPATTESE